MIKRVFFGLIVLMLAVWFGLGLARNPGMVLIHYSDMIIRLPIWLALVLIILFVLLIYCFLTLMHHTRGIPQSMQHWRRRRRWKKAKALTDRGLIQFTEGKWDLAEKWLIKGAKYSVTPLINYLAAARAAQEQDALLRRDDYLRSAHASTKGSEIAVGLTQAQLQMNALQQEQALATLQYLRELAPHHRYVLKLLATLYVDRKDWQQLSGLLPYLSKYKVLETTALEDLSCTAYDHLMKSHIHNQSLDRLNEQWQTLPYGLQKKPVLIARYAEGLVYFGEHIAAEHLLYRGLKKAWNDDLLYWYGHVRSKEPTKQLMQGEKWLRQYGVSPALLLCLARLCMRCQLWGKARGYLEQLLAQDPTPEVYAELGQWHEHNGDKDQAIEYYHRGLSLAIKE
ncbi:MAG: heme biosynthesis HemY N-terminal domain-containing protein [Gammaproteobacteria bacterium]